jgi:hypothetical protein
MLSPPPSIMGVRLPLTANIASKDMKEALTNAHPVRVESTRV